jgi:hypothetical protein
MILVNGPPLGVDDDDSKDERILQKFSFLCHRVGEMRRMVPPFDAEILKPQVKRSRERGKMSRDHAGEIVSMPTRRFERIIVRAPNLIGDGQPD